MELCVGFTSDEWRSRLRPRLDGDHDEAWQEAASILERRLKERFLCCIEALLKLDKIENLSEPVRPGFSVMALCCLLVETLEFYRGGGRTMEVPEAHEAAPRTGGPPTAKNFKGFLKRSKYFNRDFYNSDICGDFAINVRNGILHEAETRGGWLIERSRPHEKIVEKIKGGYILNRTAFYGALRSELDEYLDQLRDPANNDLRRNFLKKMDELCESAPQSE